MCVTEQQSGITSDHIQALQDFCAEWNVFLFIRPTERVCTQLIKEHYPTKSVDVHDKTSNWGPMAGFVPCDQFFSKHFIGEPNPNASYSQNRHAVAQVLALPSQRLANLETTGKITKTEDAGCRRIYTAQTSNPMADRLEFVLDKTGDNWEVSWRHCGETDITSLMVWTYGDRPVTGDYDLFMATPHMSWWKFHIHHLDIPGKHGISRDTLFTKWLVSQLNCSLGRSDVPVFNHGTEMQNLHFTQTIERDLVMFTAAGGSRMVLRTDLPTILSDLQSAGYLVNWNRKHGEPDPGLNGKPSTEDELTHASLRNKRNPLLKTIPAGSRIHDLRDMKDFFRDLRSALQTRRKDPEFLKVGEGKDLPANYKNVRGTLRSFKAQKRLQNALVGTGRNTIEDVNNWVNENLNDILVLCETYDGTADLKMPPPSEFFVEGLFERRELITPGPSALRSVLDTTRQVEPTPLRRASPDHGLSSLLS